MIPALIIMILFIVFFPFILKVLDIVLPIAFLIALLLVMKEALHLPY